MTDSTELILIYLVSVVAAALVVWVFQWILF